MSESLEAGRFTARMPEELRIALGVLAAKHRRTVAHELRVILQAALIAAGEIEDKDVGRRTLAAVKRAVRDGSDVETPELLPIEPGRERNLELARERVAKRQAKVARRVPQDVVNTPEYQAMLDRGQADIAARQAQTVALRTRLQQRRSMREPRPQHDAAIKAGVTLQQTERDSI